MDNKNNCHWRLSGVAQSPYIKRRVSETATYSVGVGPVGRGDIDWKHSGWSRPLQREAAIVAAPAGVPVMSLHGTLLPIWNVRATGAIRGKADVFCSDGALPGLTHTGHLPHRAENLTVVGSAPAPVTTDRPRLHSGPPRPRHRLNDTRHQHVPFRGRPNTTSPYRKE
jgi:hypothetical protein